LKTLRRTTERALRGLERFNREHPWSHNDLYIPWILWQARRVRRRGRAEALDIGCGTGHLLKRLAPIVEQVTGIEPDPATAALARRNLSGVEHAVIHEGPFGEEPGATYDLVTFIASLHHMPLRDSLQRARRMLRPGGRLLVVGVARESPADWPYTVISTLLNPVIGVFRQLRRVPVLPPHMAAPATEALQTFTEIAEVMRHELPGVRIRRGLFWRYTAAWTRT